MPTSDADDAGVLRINGQQIDDRNGGKGADPVFPSFVALADPSTDEVLGCGTAPIAVATARPLAAVVWISDADAAAYQTYEMGTPANRLGVQRISASLPSNDSLSSPTPISSLPFEYDGDNARATLDGPALPDPYGCFSEIVGVYGSTVWFRWTATSSGRIQTRVITDGFYRSNYPKGIAGAIVVAVVALLLDLTCSAVSRRRHDRA